MDDVSRREALRLTGIGTASVTAGGLAGCLGGSGDGDGSGDDGGDGSGTDGGTDGGDTDGGSDGGSSDGGSDLATWRTAELTDLTADETFTIREFDRPVLVETFAVWCSNCKRQQDELIDFHEAVGDDVVSVALNVDPNEDAGKIRSHADSNGYHWRYAVSPPAVTQSLVDEFGADVTTPPIVPMILVCPDGSVHRLKDGHKSTSFLRDRIDEC